jgi:ADP-heptose:LPS heptosyltransferase
MKKVLILNLVPNTLGDSIIMTPMFSIIKKNYPSAFVAATADNMTKELWSGNKEIDEIIEIGELSVIGDRNAGIIKKTFCYLKMFFMFINKLRKFDFDTCFITFPNFCVMPLIPLCAGIKNRIGFTYMGAYFSFLLTKKTESKILFDGYLERHIVDSFIDLLSVSGLKFSKKDIVSKIEISKKEQMQAKKKLGLKGKLISIHTLSKLESKNWPKEKFAVLLPLLAKRYNAKILLHGSKKEFEYNEKIRRKNPDIYNLCGKYSIREVGAILKISDLFIGNDSGLGHYASSVGTKTITLFGASYPTQAIPIGKGKTIALFNANKNEIYNFYKKGDISLDIKAMDAITIDDVLMAAAKQLG